jgi:hypothetical protein
MISTAISSAAIMFGLALVISMLVAGLISLLFFVVRKFGGGS